MIEKHPITASRLQKIPFSKKKYRYLLPLFPGAVESFDLSGFDLVISTSHAVAKGAITDNNTLSICYCHTPMRYIWDQYDVYFNTDRTSPLIKSVMPIFRDYLRHWDVSTENRVDYYIANSRFVADRIKRLYKRKSTVIPAPVNCEFYTPSQNEPEDFYLIVSALAPYKRVELAVKAFNENGRKLVVIGGGTEASSLMEIAGENIEFLGRVSDEKVLDHYQRCKGLVFPGVEDFGLVPLETQACGRPVIAYGEGGALETIVEGVSGHFFFEQSIESLNQAITAFERMSFSKDVIRCRAFEFDQGYIERKLRNYLNDKLLAHNLPALPAFEEQTTC